jgi:hypothetical protein
MTRATSSLETLAALVSVSPLSPLLLCPMALDKTKSPVAGAPPATAGAHRGGGWTFPFSPFSFSFLSRAVQWQGELAPFLCLFRPWPVVSVEATPVTRHGSGRRQRTLPPKGAFPFRSWWRKAPPLPMFFDRCLGMPMRIGSRRTVRPEMAALLCQRARGLFR